MDQNNLKCNMVVDTVLVSSNDNPNYYSHFPFIHKNWARIGMRCILIFISNNLDPDSLPEQLLPFKDDIIIYPPPEKLHHVFVAQNIRLLYPALLKNSKSILISDIDMHPINIGYFKDIIEKNDDHTFVNFGYDKSRLAHIEYYMCYNVATPEIWGKVFDISTIEDINNRLIQWYENLEYHFDEKYRSKCLGFHNDQRKLFQCVNEFQQNGGNVKILDKDFVRFECPELTQSCIDTYVDWHIPKPLSKYYWRVTRTYELLVGKL